MLLVIRIHEVFEKFIADSIHSVENPPEWRLSHDSYRHIAHDYARVAKGYLFLGNSLDKAMQYYERSCDCYLKHLKLGECFSSTAYDAMITSILSRKSDTIDAMIAQLGKEFPFREGHGEGGYSYHLSPLIFSVLYRKNNPNLYTNYLTKFLEKEEELTKHCSGLNMGDGMAIQSIIDRNFEDFLAVIEKIIRFDIRSLPQCLDLPISIRATYLIFLARDQGMNLSNDILKKRFKETHQGLIRQTLLMA